LTHIQLDEEDDIGLIDAAKHAISGWDRKIMHNYKDRLEELGIVRNGFMNLQKMTALQLGGFGQIMNIIKGLAKELNIPEKRLLEMSKQYN